MNRKIALLLCALACAAPAKAATITWGAYQDVGFSLNGLMLEDNSLMQLGVFDVPLSDVLLNSNDMVYLSLHFTPLDSIRTGNAGVAGADGYALGNFNVDTRASQNTLGDDQVYLWVFKSTDNSSITASRNTATHAALLTLNNSSWRLPTDPESAAPGELLTDANQLTTGGAAPLLTDARLIQGTFPEAATGEGGNTHFGLVVIPEPSTGMALGLGLLALACRRRRKALSI